MLNIIKQFKVDHSHLANTMGSGNLNVLATPALVTFMENVAFEYAQEELSDAQTTVGISMVIEHIAPTTVNSVVEVIIKNVISDGKMRQFEMVANVNGKRIGTGVHRRVIVTTDNFLSKL